MEKFYVYILTNKHHTVLYIGITNNLMRRIYEHQQMSPPGFTEKYKVTRLVYFEGYERVYDAINREKKLKAGPRKKKINLIESINPKWRDLSENIY